MRVEKSELPVLVAGGGIGGLAAALALVRQGFKVKALALYQRSRVARTARIVLSSREMGRIYHAKGVERLVRNDLWQGRTPERFYDAMEWLYGWNVGNCLADH
jgi:2-polyprenyl-6-methoxyphenol hydroxylase-like FAD-dependent oxidoreductase